MHTYNIGSVYHTRLFNLREFVQSSLTQSQLDISSWFNVDIAKLKQDSTITYQDFNAINNSKACVLGWASLLPEFQTDRLEVKLITHQSIITQSKQKTFSVLTIIYHADDQTDYMFFDAAQHFFGLTSTDTHYLFNSTVYGGLVRITPMVIGERLTEIINRFI